MVCLGRGVSHAPPQYPEDLKQRGGCSADDPGWQNQSIAGQCNDPGLTTQTSGPPAGSPMPCKLQEMGMGWKGVTYIYERVEVKRQVSRKMNLMGKN